MPEDTKSTPQPGAPATGGQPGGTPPPAPPAAPPAAGEPPGSPGPDYERKFKGLQPIHQNLQAQHKAVRAEKATLATQLGELQGSLDLARGEIDSLKTSRDEGVVNFDQVKSELVDYKLWEHKLTRLRQTAPHLAQFEKYITVELPDDLLVDPSTLQEAQVKQLDAAIDSAITEFGAVVGAYTDTAAKGEHAGTVPPSSPGKGGQPTLDSLYDLAIKAAGTPEYDALMQQYQKLAEKEVGKADESGKWRPTPNF